MPKQTWFNNFMWQICNLEVLKCAFKVICVKCLGWQRKYIETTMVSRVIFRHRLLVPKFSCPSRTYISPSLTKERLMTEYQRCRTYTLGKFDKTGLTSKELCHFTWKKVNEWWRFRQILQKKFTWTNLCTFDPVL